MNGFGEGGFGCILLAGVSISVSGAQFDPAKLPGSLKKIEQLVATIDSSTLSKPDKIRLMETKEMSERLGTAFATYSNVNDIPKTQKFKVRKDVIVMDRNINALLKKEEVRLSDSEKDTMKQEIKKVRKITDYSPRWVIVMISLSLGLGTMIGWKRIVKTVGEKIGKEHLTYAQGASAELVASMTIGLSTNFGWPVSTTHVLSSGIAGSMVASKGVKNLQPDTVRNILMAWFLTLPVVMIMGGSLFLLFRSIF